MSQLIQFPCPACGTQLRLPLAAAARQGACPSCREEIVAPDPECGTGAHVATADETPAPPESPAAAPRKSTPPPPPPRVKSPPAPAPPYPELPPAPVLTAQLPTAAEAGNGPPVVTALLSAAIGLAIGLAVGFPLGARSKPEAKPTPPPAPPSASPFSAATTPPAPQTESEAIVPAAAAPEESQASEEPAPQAPAPEASITPEPATEESPTPAAENPAPTPAPVKASAAAEATLQAFLEAPDWAARSVHVLFPDRVRATMEAYSHEVPDGPTNFGNIAVKQSQIDEATGNTLFIFVVTTEKFPDGIPVAVKETESGWLVDWLTFVEFRDGLFGKFLAGPVDQPGVFHLLATTPPDNTNAPKNPNFTAYVIRSPMGGDPQSAFVRNGSPTATRLAAQTAGGMAYAPVLELVKRSTPDKREFLEILAVRADDWFPREIP